MTLVKHNETDIDVLSCDVLKILKIVFFNGTSIVKYFLVFKRIDEIFKHLIYLLIRFVLIFNKQFLIEIEREINGTNYGKYA